MSGRDPAVQITLIRHAPARSEGLLCGRRDVACDLPGEGEVAAVRRAVGDVDRVISSPALRCRQTAAALWGERDIPTDARLWEQNFGEWEGVLLSDLPDLGPLGGAELAAHRPPGGETFEEVVARVSPVLEGLTGTVALVVHAGVIRAALSQVVGVAATVGFAIDPLSVTRLHRHDHGVWSVGFCSWRPL